MDKKVNHYDNDKDLKLKPPNPERKESESSIARSRHIPENNLTQSIPHLKTYGFYFTNRHTNIKVCDPEKNVIYLSKFHEFSSKPDIVLHEGVDKHAPIIAVARFRFSRDIKLGLGDPAASEEDMMWEDMKNISRGIGHSKYHFEMTVDNERRSFLWQRTRDAADGVSGLGKLINWNYKLVDGKTGEVVAVYLENFMKSWKKKGKLQLKADLGKDWELIVLLGSLGLCAKANRRARRRAGAAGGAE